MVACSTCSSGYAANLTDSSKLSFTWNGTAATSVLSVQYAYDAGKQDWVNLYVTVDGDDEGAVLLESTRSDDVYLDAPVEVDLATGSVVELTSPGTNGGGALFVESILVFSL